MWLVQQIAWTTGLLITSSSQLSEWEDNPVCSTLLASLEISGHKDLYVMLQTVDKGHLKVFFHNNERLPQ